MAVDFCIGFETGSLSSEPLSVTTVGTSLTTTGSVSLETSIVRTGTGSLKLTPASGAAGNWGTTGWSQLAARFYVKVTSLPASTRELFGGSTASAATLCLKSDGAIELRNGGLAGTLLGTSTTKLTDSSAWYRIEVQVAASDNRVALNGTTEITNANALLLNPLWGATDTTAATYTAYVDDIARSTTFPVGEGRTVLLLPVSDNAAGSWKKGSAANAVAFGGTGFEAVNNTPPVGTVTPEATTAAISNNVSGATSPNCDMNMATYASAGIAGRDLVNLVMPLIWHGEDVATGTKTGTNQIVSNPAGSASSTFNYGNDVGAVNTFPTNWRYSTSGSVAGPTVTVGTSPVLRVSKTDTGTRAADVCFMGLYVDYTPGVAAEMIKVQQAINRSASW